MIYDLMNKTENLKIYDEILRVCGNKIIIATNNIFIASSIIGELKNLSHLSGYELYDRSEQINKHVTSNDKIVVTTTKEIDTLSIDDINDYIIVELVPREDNEFVFDINKYPVKRDGDITEGNKIPDSIVSRVGKVNEILEAMKYYTVVVVEDLSDKIITELSMSGVVFNKLDSVEDIIEYSTKCNIVAFKCKLETDDDYDEYLKYLKYVVYSDVCVLCDISWMKALMDICNSEWILDISFTVVYSDKKKRNLGTESLYTEVL